jgi:hypothetical protein
MKIKYFAFLALGMLSSIVHAQTYTYGFENEWSIATPIGPQIVGPSMFKDLIPLAQPQDTYTVQTNPISYDAATFTGGAVLTNATDFPAHTNFFQNNQNAYGTSNMGNLAGLIHPLITIDFLAGDHPNSVSFNLFNGLTTKEDYTVTASLGTGEVVTQIFNNLNGNNFFDPTTTPGTKNFCANTGCGSFETVLFNNADIAKITIAPNFHSGDTTQWDFLIDDVTFIGNGVSPVPEPESYAMMLAGLVLMGFVGRRRKIR